LAHRLRVADGGRASNWRPERCRAVARVLPSRHFANRRTVRSTDAETGRRQVAPLEQGMKQSGLSQATDVFKAAGHPARLRILGMLRTGGLCACQVTAVLGLAASTVSAHLAELRRAGFVDEDRNGRWVRYSLAQGAAAAALLGQVWALLEGDPQVEADARLVRGLRRVAVEDLCRVELDVTRVGLRRQAAGAAARRV
jgi:DNA-binding transcriptional ArsR family regulator